MSEQSPDQLGTTRMGLSSHDFRDKVPKRSIGGMAMRLNCQTFFATVSVLILAATTAAWADVTISSDATENMNCSDGVCQPTAGAAVLNVDDLESLLASGNVTVTTTAPGVQAANIDVTAKLGWSANTLKLDAWQSISVTAPVTINGASGLSILTNDGGSGGELGFSEKGHATFKNLSASLTINGTSYLLESSIASLASAIESNPSANYALAADYDAGKDGTYGSSPIAAALDGSFEGLGNGISNLTIIEPSEKSAELTGLFSIVYGAISDLTLTHASLQIKRFKGKNDVVTASAGLLAGGAMTISRCSVEGIVSVPRNTAAGGLVGGAVTISESQAHVTVKVGSFSFGGGMVGLGSGTISLSFASGTVSGPHGGGEARVGGLVGFNDLGAIDNSYASAKVLGGSATGGLVGVNDGDIVSSYSEGKVRATNNVGGLVGGDISESGSLSNTYWDMDTSGVTNPDQGAGSPLNDPGITGLSTAQLQAGLPAGFDPSVWGENSTINNGMPYLLANPPK